MVAPEWLQVAIIVEQHLHCSRIVPVRQFTEFTWNKKKGKYKITIGEHRFDGEYFHNRNISTRTKAAQRSCVLRCSGASVDQLSTGTLRKLIMTSTFSVPVGVSVRRFDGINSITFRLVPGGDSTDSDEYPRSCVC